MVHIRFEQPDGSSQDIDATVGESLMASAKAQGVEGILAECGGSMVCGTCHVYVKEPWFSQLAAPSAMEADMLDCGLQQQPNSRLSCQIIVAPDMDGMEIAVPQSQR
jgi:2Fe-2S ferredoxin